MTKAVSKPEFDPEIEALMQQFHKDIKRFRIELGKLVKSKPESQKHWGFYATKSTINKVLDERDNLLDVLD